MWNRAGRLAIVKNHTCTRTYILHAALVIAFLKDRLYTHNSSVFLSQVVPTCLSHHCRLQELELKELVEMLLVNVPGVRVAVLWQTEGSPNAASCGQKTEFRELRTTESSTSLVTSSSRGFLVVLASAGWMVSCPVLVSLTSQLSATIRSASLGLTSDPLWSSLFGVRDPRLHGHFLCIGSSVSLAPLTSTVCLLRQAWRWQWCLACAYFISSSPLPLCPPLPTSVSSHISTNLFFV